MFTTIYSTCNDETFWRLALFVIFVFGDDVQRNNVHKVYIYWHAFIATVVTTKKINFPIRAHARAHLKFGGKLVCVQHLFWILEQFIYYLFTIVACPNSFTSEKWPEESHSYEHCCRFLFLLLWFFEIFC